MTEQIGGKWPDENGLYLAGKNMYGPIYLTADEMRAYVAEQDAARASYLGGNTVETVLERMAAESRERERERERLEADERARVATDEANRLAALVQQKQAALERFVTDSGGWERANLATFETTWQQYLARLAIDGTSG